MRVGVIGCGSIGLRHLANLKALGIHDLLAFDPMPEARQAAAEEPGIATTETLDALWDAQPEAAIIASPTSLHLLHASMAARANCHLFIEKPLSHQAEGLAELEREVAHRGLISLVGCNMRFHPGPAMVRKILNQGELGRIVSARVYSGSYLPEWRPRQDYRLGYSARASLGGGCVLDLIHEIDLARWYLGDVDEVMCMAARLSSLELDVEDVAALLCRHRTGLFSEIHLDFVTRPAGRGCEIFGERGAVFWKLQDRNVRMFHIASGQWSEFQEPDGWELNQMYLDEMSHFLECVKARRRTVCDVAEGIAITHIALAAKASARSGSAVRMSEFQN